MSTITHIGFKNREWYIRGEEDNWKHRADEHNIDSSLYNGIVKIKDNVIRPSKSQLESAHKLLLDIL